MRRWRFASCERRAPSARAGTSPYDDEASSEASLRREAKHGHAGFHGKRRKRGKDAKYVPKSVQRRSKIAPVRGHKGEAQRPEQVEAHLQRWAWIQDE